MRVVEAKCDFIGSSQVGTFDENPILSMESEGILIESQVFRMSGAGKGSVHLGSIAPGLSEIGKEVGLAGSETGEFETLVCTSVTHAVIQDLTDLTIDRGVLAIVCGSETLLDLPAWSRSSGLSMKSYAIDCLVRASVDVHCAGVSEAGGNPTVRISG